MGNTITERAAARAPGALSLTAWRLESDISSAEWASQGKRLGALGRGAGWWIGDWLRYGNERFGERYARAARITGYDAQTLMNMVYVASRFDFSRRREGLSWSHHAELAAMAEEEQEQWLDAAERERMSIRCMRQEIRREARLRAAPEPRSARPSTRSVELVCPQCGAPMRG